MAPRKGTPEYDAWKQTPEYAARNRQIAASKKGKPYSEEAKRNMSAAQKAAYAALSDEEKAKRRETNNLVQSNGSYWIGRHHTDETKTKLAEQRKGIPPTNKGVSMTEEQRRKASEAAKKRPPRSRESLASFIEAGQKASQTPGARAKQAQSITGHFVSDVTKAKIKEKRKDQPPTFLGKRHTEESKSKMAAAGAIATKARWEKMTPQERAAFTEKRIASIPMRNTAPENFVARQLDKLGVTYVRQKQFWHYIVDFFLPDFNLVIEVNGCYWHCCEECGFINAHEGKREKDAKRHEYLIKRGFSLGIMWEHDLLPLMKSEKRE